MNRRRTITRWSQITAIVGICTALVCIVTILLSATVQTGYNHKHHTLSRLTTYNGPYNLVITIIFFVYNLLLISTGIGWFLLQKWVGKRSATAARLIIVTGIFGLALNSFPQDPDDAPMSIYGVAHKVIAISMMLTALAAMIAQGIFEMERGRLQLSLYTNFSAVFVLITGSLATVSIEADWLFGAVLERITLAGFLVWIVVESIMVYKSHSG